MAAEIINMKTRELMPDAPAREPLEDAWNGVFSAIEKLVTEAQKPGFAQKVLIHEETKATYSQQALLRHLDKRLAFVRAAIPPVTPR